jgi:hypothetical protein
MPAHPQSLVALVVVVRRGRLVVLEQTEYPQMVTARLELYPVVAAVAVIQLLAVSRVAALVAPVKSSLHITFSQRPNQP